MQTDQGVQVRRSADGVSPCDVRPSSYPLVMTNKKLLKMAIYSGFTH